MRRVDLFNSLCVAMVVVAMLMSVGYGEWFIWVPVTGAVASVAGLRHSVSRRPRR